ncbi:MAG: hypothetical protein AB1589_30670 [Cyanobacteriota bacterium]
MRVPNSVLLAEFAAALGLYIASFSPNQTYNRSPKRALFPTSRLHSRILDRQSEPKTALLAYHCKAMPSPVSRLQGKANRNLSTIRLPSLYLQNC